MEQRFYKSWLFSLGGNFFDPRNPSISTGGQTLGIAFNKADNPQVFPQPRVHGTEAPVSFALSLLGAAGRA